LNSYLNNGDAQSDFPRAFGHGTLVAGVIHAVAPGAQIVPIRAFDARGYTSMFTVMEGVYAAIDQEIDVLNMSFSTGEESLALRLAISEAVSRGITVVASAGNEGREANDLFPAAFPGVHGVAATDSSDRIAAFSNYGKGISLSAPGAFVVSTAPGGRYAAAWGTSFSAPMVSAGAALLTAVGSRRNGEAALLINAADPIDALNPGFEKKLGKGRLNVRQALQQR
jgi:subtilisin family serine protease